MASPSRKRSPSTIGRSPGDEQREKRQRLPKTCEWILKHPAYTAWRAGEEDSTSLLWLHGPPGSGKTVLAHSVVNFIQEEDDPEQNPIVYSYFCDANSTPNSLIRSILVQLQEHPLLDNDARDALVNSTAEPSPGAPALPLDTTHKLWSTLFNVFPGLHNTTLVIDGLDEIPDNYLQQNDFDLPSKLRALSASDDQKAKVLVSSRTHGKIQNALKEQSSILVTEDLVKDDLEHFIESELAKFPVLEAWGPLIRKPVLEQSEGNFVWASLAIKELDANISRRALIISAENLQEILENIPTSLDDLYASVISKQAAVLSPDEISFRNQILQWVIFSVRPLHSDELIDALQTTSDSHTHDVDENQITGACGSLIKLENGVWKPVHHSLREYLLKEAASTEPTVQIDSKLSHLMVAKSLLLYLSQPAFSQIGEPLDEEFQYKHPLVEYATLYWIHHVRNASPDPELEDSILRFFGSPTNCIQWADKLLPHYLPNSRIPVPPRPFNTARFLHLFALKGQLASYFSEEKRKTVANTVEDILRTAYEKFLAQAQSKAGPESIDAAKRLMDLAEVYSWLPEYKSKSVSLLQAASFIIEKRTDASARQLRAAVAQTLADDYKRSGKYSDAQKLLTDMLADETLLSDGFQRMFALDSLGWVNMRLGDLNAAEPFLRDATDLAVQIYGDNSPMTLRPKVTLAEVLSKLGRHDEAGAFCGELKRQLNEHHHNGVPLPKDSISQLHTLGMILMQEGKFQEAISTYRIVVEDRRKMFGDHHGMTIGAEMMLGIATEKAGDTESAKILFENLLPRQEKTLGEDHPDVKELKKRLAQM